MNYTIDVEQNLIRIVGTGRLTDRDLMGCVSALREDPDLSPGMNTLSDMREIEVGFTSHGLLKMIDLMAETDSKRSGAMAAIVVTSDVAFGMGRMLENLADDRVNPSFQIFRTVDDARSWLGIG